MKVILTEDVKALGKRGAIVNVSDGYARNFIFPKKLGIVASDAALAHEQERIKQEKVKLAKILAEAKEVAAKLGGQAVILKAKSGEHGKLFGAITAKEVAVAVKEQLKYEVDKRKIKMEDNIKTVGENPVSFKLHPEVTVTVKIRVESEA